MQQVPGRALLQQGLPERALGAAQAGLHAGIGEKAPPRPSSRPALPSVAALAETVAAQHAEVVALGREVGEARGPESGGLTREGRGTQVSL